MTGEPALYVQMLRMKFFLSVPRFELGFPQLDTGAMSRYTLVCVWLIIQEDNESY